MAKRSTHYINNAEFYEALKTYLTARKKAKNKNKELPPIPEYVGECFLKIATNLAHKPNFASYTFKDDMISDGIENCLTYLHNFNPKKTHNPFGYFTQIIYFAFIRRIQREKKHTYIKYKLMEKLEIDGGAHIDSNVPDGEAVTTSSKMLKFDNVQDFISRYENYTAGRRERRRTAKTKK